MRPTSLSLVLLITLVITPLSAQLENFDGAPQGTASCATAATTTTGFPYNGWTNDPGDVGTSFRVWSGGTGSFNTGPSGDLCGTGNYVYLETSCSAAVNIGSLVSPVFSAAGIGTPVVNFWYHMFGATMGMLELQESDGIGGWTTIWMLSGDQGDMWFQQEVPINTFDVGNGPEVQFRFRGTRGTSFTSDMAFDEVRFGAPSGPSPNQANSANASLNFTGTSCNPGACGGSGPYFRALFPGQSTTATIGSGANGVQPYALVHTPGFGAIMGQGIFTPAGMLDFSFAGYTNLQFLIDGIGGTGFIDQWLGTTLPGGSRDLELNIPPSMPGPLTTFQALVLDPTSMVGSALTAATQLDVAPGNGTLPASQLGTTGLPLGDSTSMMIDFSSVSFNFPFYGAFYSSCFVNSDGSITFGGDDIDATESVFDLENEEARIAGWWDDLDVTEGGQIAYTLTGSSFLVSWNGVPEDTLGNSNNFAILIDASGLITLFYGAMDAQDGLVGISPGFNSPVGPPNANMLQVDFSTAPSQSVMGGAQDSIFELFPVGAGDLGISACGGGVTLLFFAPQVPITIPGDTGYTAP